MNGSFDILVLGQAGLAAAALAAQAGKRVLLVRAAEPPVHVGPLHALDPRLVERLHLARHGLSFLERDLPQVVLRDDARPVVLTRDRQDEAAALSALSHADARHWPLVRRQMFRRARALRRWWEQDQGAGTPADVLIRRKDRAAFAWLQWAGADAWTGQHLDSDALRGALLFDAVEGGFAPSEPGSALALVWRAAQEMAGRQGAVALPRPGTLERSLRLAADAANVTILEGRIRRIDMSHGRALGVTLADGERIEGGILLSALPRVTTLALMGLPGVPEQAPVGETHILLTLSAAHDLAPGRYVLAGSPAHQADAYEAARDGRLIADPPLSFVPVMSHQIAVTLRPVPVQAFDASTLTALAVKAMARHVPGLARGLGAVSVTREPRGTRATLTRLVQPALVRAATPAANVILCGADAEPVPCLSGRAARLAAAWALRG
jgi:phytoene dehydrogenase-like protein